MSTAASSTFTGRFASCIPFQSATAMSPRTSTVAAKENGCPFTISGTSSTRGSETACRLCSVTAVTNDSRTSWPATSARTRLPNIRSSTVRGTLPLRNPFKLTFLASSRNASPIRLSTVIQGTDTMSFFSTGETSSILTCMMRARSYHNPAPGSTPLSGAAASRGRAPGRGEN
jgi:hypothetical protein